MGRLAPLSDQVRFTMVEKTLNIAYDLATTTNLAAVVTIPARTAHSIKIHAIYPGYDTAAIGAVTVADSTTTFASYAVHNQRELGKEGRPTVIPTNGPVVITLSAVTGATGSVVVHYE